MSSTSNWAEGLRRQFPVGDSVTAYTNPSSPSEGYLIHRLSWFPLIFVAIPLLMGALVAHALRYGQQGLTLAGARDRRTDGLRRSVAQERVPVDRSDAGG